MAIYPVLHLFKYIELHLRNNNNNNLLPLNDRLCRQNFPFFKSNEAV